MATGTLSSLGIASNVLKQDVLDQLKLSEEKAQVTPYTTKIEKNTAKQTALTELNTKLLSLRTQVSSLGDATAFQKRTVTPNVTGDSAAASLTASSGVSVQNMSVSVTQLADKDVFQSKGFSGSSNRVLDGTNQTQANFTLLQNGKTYTIRISQNDTYEDLATKINDTTDGKIVAKLVNTGEEGSPYRLTLSSSETGSKNAITFIDGVKDTAQGSTGYTSDAGASALLNSLGWSLNKVDANGNATTNDKIDTNKNVGFSLNDPNNEYYIKHAKDAKFELDGVSMTRSSNTITDIGAGLTLTLKQKGDINFDVKQDTAELASTMEKLVEAYNDLMNTLESATKYDTETKVAGDLQGVSEVTNIRSRLVNILFKSQSVEGTEVDDSGNSKSVSVMVSLQDYGLTLNDKDKTLSFDKSKFDKKITKDVDFAEKFFAGTSGFEELNVVGDAKRAKFDTDIDLTGKELKIVFNEKTYDLTKDTDGKAFNNIKGNTAAERAQSLVDHINSLGIEDLKVSLQELNLGGTTGYSIKFKSDNGSNFELTGDTTILNQLGFDKTKVTPQVETGTGIFASLKETINNITGTNGSLTLYSSQLKTENKSLTESRKSTQERLDARYETLTAQWIAYEKIIAKLQQQGNKITQMIDAMSQGK